MSEVNNSAIISEGMTVIRGAITNKNGLVIFGKVLRGSVTSLSEVTVEESGVQRLEIAHVVHGGGDTFVGKPNSVKGTIDCGSIIIEEGAVICDSTKTLGEKLILDKLRADKIYCELERGASRTPEAPAAK